ncbi:MAG: 50S ribosomal protein L25/general stress protein Ctc [Pseudomonadota bacterium]
MTEFFLTAQPREETGRRASRRMRRGERVPAVLYGGGEAAQSISLEHREIAKLIEDERAFSHIISLKTDGAAQDVVIRDLQMHPYKPRILHVDLQRVKAGQQILVHVPLHFVGEAECVGVRLGGGQLHHILVEVEVSAPADRLPEFIEVDVAKLDKGQTLHLSDLRLPAGVTIPALAHGDDKAVVNVSAPRGAAEEAPTEEGAA